MFSSMRLLYFHSLSKEDMKWPTTTLIEFRIHYLSSHSYPSFVYIHFGIVCRNCQWNATVWREWIITNENFNEKKKPRHMNMKHNEYCWWEIKYTELWEKKIHYIIKEDTSFCCRHFHTDGYFRILSVLFNWRRENVFKFATVEQFRPCAWNEYQPSPPKSFFNRIIGTNHFSKTVILNLLHSLYFGYYELKILYSQFHCIFTVRFLQFFIVFFFFSFNFQIFTGTERTNWIEPIPQFMQWLKKMRTVFSEHEEPNVKCHFDQKGFVSIPISKHKKIQLSTNKYQFQIKILFTNYRFGTKLYAIFRLAMNYYLKQKFL